MTCRRLLAALCCASLVGLGAAPSLAAPPGSVEQPVDAARGHFLRGVELYRAGAYDAALAEFTRAYELSPNYRILYNLAQIQAQRHDPVEAVRLFRRYLSDGDGKLTEARINAVEAEIVELERRVATLRVSSNAPAARLFVDDVPVAELPLTEPLLVNAGIHHLRVEKPGRLSAFRTVTLTGGDALELTLELEPGPDALELNQAPAPVPRRPLPAEPEVDRSAFWLSLAATGVLTGVTATLALMTHQADRELERELDKYPAPRAPVDDARERVRSLAIATDALAIASVLSAGVSTYFYFAAPTSREQTAPLGLKAELGPTRSQVLWVGAF